MNIQLLTYSDKAVILLGDTKQVKDQLKAMNGRFNPFLKHPQTGERCIGWIFSKKHESELKRLFVLPNVVGCEPVTPVISTPEPITAPQPKDQPKVEPELKEVVKTGAIHDYHEDLITVYNEKTKQAERVKRGAVVFGTDDYKEGLNVNFPYPKKGHGTINVVMPEYKVSTDPAPKLKEKPFVAIFTGATFQGEKTFKTFNEYQKFIKEVSPKDNKGRPTIQNFKVEFKQL